MLWGALTHPAQDELRAIASASGPRRVPRGLASDIVQASQSLAIDGRVVPPVLSAEPDDALDTSLTPEFTAWIRDHEL